jgi:hypothetical protein
VGDDNGTVKTIARSPSKPPSVSPKNGEIRVAALAPPALSDYLNKKTTVIAGFF